MNTENFDDTEDFFESFDGSNYIENDVTIEVSEALHESGALSSYIASAFAGYPDHLRVRLSLNQKSIWPDVSLWSILKNSIGKDLSKITLPVYFNEPTSMLQRMAEDMEYSELLDIAARHKESTERILYVAAFAMSNYSSTVGRVAKPFNPLLGETYEYVRPDKTFRYISEQVSHHPPISACYCESPHYDFFSEVDVKSRFWGKSFEILPKGVSHVNLKVPKEYWPKDQKERNPNSFPAKGNPKAFSEHYSWKKVTTCVNNLIVGSPVIDHYGDMVITNHLTGDKCTLTFKARGWRGKDAYEIRGVVNDAQGTEVWEIAGRWNERLVARRSIGARHSSNEHDLGSDAAAESATLPNEIDNNGAISPTTIEKPTNSKSLSRRTIHLLWKRATLPEEPILFNLTPFALTLNDLPDSLKPWVAPTDSRMRPDQRAMENGNYDLASSEKTRLEEKQRSKRAAREQGEIEEWKPRWFKRDVEPDTTEGYWLFNHEYWQERERTGKEKTEGTGPALKKRTQGPGKVVTEYAKAIRKLIKRVDSRRNWTEEQKIYFFTKRLRTDLLYALWPFLALKDNPTMDMVIELAQQIEDNQKMYLESTFPVFALVSIMTSAPQMAATFFAAQTQNPNEHLIDRLTTNLVWLLEPLAQAQNHGPPVCYYYGLTEHFLRDCNNSPLPSLAPRNNNTQNNRLNNNNVLNQRPNYANINFFGENPLKKKKAKVDFILDSKKASTSIANNNELLKAKVFKNSLKLEFPEIVQKSGSYFVIKNLMKTPVHITFGQLMTHPQFRKDLSGLTDNSNVTPLICKAQVTGYFIDLILDSRSSVSVIAKHFFEAIGRIIDEFSTRPMTNIHNDKKKDLGIAKAISVRINDISIETDMEISEAKKYTIIVSNKWLKKAKALLDYELCKLTIKCGEKSIVVNTQANQKEKQSDESDDDKSDNEDQEKQEKTVELAYTIFTSNGKPLDNVKADKEKIMVNGKLICWPYYNIFRKTFDRKPSKKAKYNYWWHGSYACDECKFCLIYYKNWKPISLIPKEELKEVQKFFKNKPPKIQFLVVKQKKPLFKEKKVDIENLLARNDSIISKKGDTPG
ncbi:hypothetical protein G9A89_008379 [Geosiphon pyriformis]|nr:hypothetical protein G9A89_008379 [Geosiphon pyriformis]